MADEDGRSGTSSFDGVIREALGGSIAPPGLAKRIRAGLDGEDARRARGARRHAREILDGPAFPEGAR